MKRCSTFRGEVVRVVRKLRRSFSDPVCESNNATLGMFGKLPLELNHHTFSYLKIEDLIALGNSSAHMKLMVEIFVNTGQCVDLKEFRHPHSIIIDANSKSFIEVCSRHRKAGLLLKSLCSEKTFTECLQILDIQLSNHLCSLTTGNCHDHPDVSVKPRNSSESPNKYPPEGSISCRLGFLRCPALHLYGHFLRAFTGDWPEHKAKRLFDHLLHHCFKTNFWHRLAELVCENPGKDSISELVLRLFLRRVFLDPAALPRPLIIGDLDRSTLLCQNPVGICDISAALLSTHTTKDEGSSCFVRVGHLATKSPNTSSGASTEMELSHVQSGVYSTTRSPDLTISTPLGFRSPCATPSNCQYTGRSLRWPASKILLRLLNCQPFVNQARILFILYGPLHKGRIMWHTMCENTAADSEQLSACFGELGSVLQNMLETGAWSPDEALSILNEITVIPDEWLAENVACLLYTAGKVVGQPEMSSRFQPCYLITISLVMSTLIHHPHECGFEHRLLPLLPPGFREDGPRLASMLITQKAATGNLGELAVTLTSLCLVRVKIRATLSDLVGLVGEACRATERMDRRVFLDQLARAFQDVIVDLYETDELEDRMEDFSTVLRAQAEFMRALMARIYEE
ncbi:hypothetical protein EG68_08971 [Paragonimus skrjabini miyazakii]|uniref:FBXO47 ARM repeats region domain-containing protein n=1 Tax=Paragonimus skrjabini miyazakii TaxID=59628 RepID=A0A8S9YGM7_9TREM|nr:hypothetical protein EG68_08971 [Paragonimus skrjabini miyazakii]